jgi:hypothetical protein
VTDQPTAITSRIGHCDDMTQPPPISPGHGEEPHTVASVMPGSPPKRSRLPLIIIASVLVLVPASLGLAFYLTRSVTVHGTVLLTVTRGIHLPGNGTCSGDGGFSDLHSGAPVTITDDRGEVLAVTRLNDGEWLPSAQACRWTRSRFLTGSCTASR